MPKVFKLHLFRFTSLIVEFRVDITNNQKEFVKRE